MTTATTAPLFDGLVAFLREDGWPVDVAPGPPATVATRCAGSTWEWACTGRTFEQQGQAVFDSALPLTVQQDLRPTFALLLARASWSLHTGSFALGPEPGEVRLRTSLVTAAGAPLDPALARAMVYANVLIVERCLPALEGALAGTLSVDEALGRLAL